jgi:HTH-type transcriptional regulator/antitoxin HigA
MRGAAFNTAVYAELLSDALPGVIRTEKENERALAVIERLMDKGDDNRSPEEDRLLELLVCLVEDFEETAYPMGNVATPVDSLKTLMAERGLKQKDLADIFGGQPIVSDVLSGKREINKRQAVELAKTYHYPVEVFL